MRFDRFLKAIQKPLTLERFVPLFLLNLVLLSFSWPAPHAVAWLCLS